MLMFNSYNRRFAISRSDAENIARYGMMHGEVTSMYACIWFN